MSSNESFEILDALSKLENFLKNRRDLISQNKEHPKKIVDEFINARQSLHNIIKHVDQNLESKNDLSEIRQDIYLLLEKLERNIEVEQRAAAIHNWVQWQSLSTDTTRQIVRIKKFITKVCEDSELENSFTGIAVFISCIKSNKINKDNLIVENSVF